METSFSLENKIQLTKSRTQVPLVEKRHVTSREDKYQYHQMRVYPSSQNEFE